jgi:hypothetical protein
LEIKPARRPRGAFGYRSRSRALHAGHALPAVVCAWPAGWSLRARLTTVAALCMTGALPVCGGTIRFAGLEPPSRYPSNHAYVHILLARCMLAVWVCPVPLAKIRSYIIQGRQHLLFKSSFHRATASGYIQHTANFKPNRRAWGSIITLSLSCTNHACPPKCKLSVRVMDKKIDCSVARVRSFG